MHLGHLIVLQSWSGNSQNFQQATFSFNGLDFVSENPKDELDDPGQFTNYTQFTWTLQNVPIANLTVLPFMIISSFPLAGQEIEFAALEEVDPVEADYEDLNCQINGQCASLQGSACTALPECSAGESLGRILLTLPVTVPRLVPFVLVFPLSFPPSFPYNTVRPSQGVMFNEKQVSFE